MMDKLLELLNQIKLCEEKNFEEIKNNFDDKRELLHNQIIVFKKIRISNEKTLSKIKEDF